MGPERVTKMVMKVMVVGGRRRVYLPSWPGFKGSRDAVRNRQMF